MLGSDNDLSSPRRKVIALVAACTDVLKSIMIPLGYTGGPGTSPIKILQPKFYASTFFKHFDWMLKMFNH